MVPTVVSPLGVDPKPHSDKKRVKSNTRHVNQHLVKRLFEFDGLSNIPDIAENTEYSVAYDLNLGYYHVPLHPSSHRFVGFEWKGTYYQYKCIPAPAYGVPRIASSE